MSNVINAIVLFQRELSPARVTRLGKANSCRETG